MKNIYYAFFLAVSTLFIAGSVFAGSSIDISNAWINQTPPNVMSNAGYMTITNNGNSTIVLKQITAQKFGMAHLHETKLENGEMKMSAVREIEIPGGDKIILEPGKLHIMLMHRQETLETGEEIEMELSFSDDQAATQTITIKARVQ